MDVSKTPVVEELSPSACWALLRESPIGRIALRGSEHIEVFPINYLVDSGTIVFRSGLGTKLELIGEGSSCTFEVDEIDVAEALVWSVVVKGRAQPVRGHDAILDTFDMEVPTWQAGPKPTFVRITPHELSGRRFPVVAAERDPR